MKRVVTFGVFDLLHYGHIKLFKRCKLYGDFLIVALQSDEFVKINKPNCNLMMDQTEREELVRSIKYVDETFIYNQIDEDLSNINFDVLVVGADQTNEHFIKAITWCKEKNKEIIYLERTPDISSSFLRKSL